MRGTPVIILAWLAAGSAAGAETSGRIRAQVGQEYDTNVHRVYSVDPQPVDEELQVRPDGLTRLLLQTQFRFASDNHHVQVEYLGGLKLFHHQTSERLIATKLEGSYRYDVSDRFWLGTRLTFRDIVMKFHDRDYRLVRAEGMCGWKLRSWLFLEAYAGGRHFYFKPDDHQNYNLKFTHAGPFAGLRFTIRPQAHIIGTLFYEVGLRFFDDLAQQFEPGSATDSSRLDLRHLGGLRIRHPIRYWGERRLILEMSYFVSVNDSNSDGSSAVWHRLRMVISMQFPLDITLHLMGTLQFTDYADGIYVEGDLYEPDADENENSVVARLTFPLWRGLSLVFQAALYRNEFHSQEFEVPSFRRETLLLGVAYDLPF